MGVGPGGVGLSFLNVTLMVISEVTVPLVIDQELKEYPSLGVAMTDDEPTHMILPETDMLDPESTWTDVGDTLPPVPAEKETVYLVVGVGPGGVGPGFSVQWA